MDSYENYIDLYTQLVNRDNSFRKYLPIIKVEKDIFLANI